VNRPDFSPIRSFDGGNCVFSSRRARVAFYELCNAESRGVNAILRGTISGLLYPRPRLAQCKITRFIAMSPSDIPIYGWLTLGLWLQMEK